MLYNAIIFANFVVFCSGLTWKSCSKRSGFEMNFRGKAEALIHGYA